MDKMSFGPTLEGLKLLHRGKVRDSYELPGYPDLMLVVASNRISIFDFVLDAYIPKKGAILNALKAYFDEALLRPNKVLTDFLCAGSAVDQYLPKAMRGRQHIWAHGTVVRRNRMIAVECIVRGYLTGSGLSDYKKTGLVGGHRLAPNLMDGSALRPAIFTPSTKASVGHDVNITQASVDSEYGKIIGELSKTLYDIAASYAASRSVILADTKLEFGYDEMGRLVLCDEYFTPDSSRYWDPADWEMALAEGRTPKPYDKQFVRNWGRDLGMHLKDPENDNDYAWVREQKVPADLIARTSVLYEEIAKRLTGLSLVGLQAKYLGF